MPRAKGPGGVWVDLDWPTPTNGTRPVVEPDPPPTDVHRATPKQIAAWAAVQRCGSVSAAARELGITPRAVRGRCDKYMRGMGLPSNARPFGPERPPVVKPRADYAETIPIAEQIADDDSDAPVLPDVPSRGFFAARHEPLEEQAAAEQAADMGDPTADDSARLKSLQPPYTPGQRVDDLLDQLSANVVDRSALLGLLGETISDLSREQSVLVLSAVVPSTVNRSTRQVADEAIAALERYGFWLVIRTTE